MRSRASSIDRSALGRRHDASAEHHVLSRGRARRAPSRRGQARRVATQGSAGERRSRSRARSKRLRADDVVHLGPPAPDEGFDGAFDVRADLAGDAGKRTVTFASAATSSARTKRWSSRASTASTRRSRSRASASTRSETRYIRSIRDAMRPIVKWAGGKTRLLASLMPHVPKRIKTYVEPFAGGAALFFALAGEAPQRFERAILCDANDELVACYRAVQKQRRRRDRRARRVPLRQETLLRDARARPRAHERDASARRDSFS